MIPEPSLEHLPMCRLTYYQQLKCMLDRFWKRWSQEYLQRLQAVAKWQRPCKNLGVGTLLLVVDERLPPAKWLPARIIKVILGADGLARVAVVRTSSGSELSRLIVKLCPLPIDSATDVENVSN